MPASKKPTFDLGPIRNRVDLATEAIAKHKVKFTLNPNYMSTTAFSVNPLTWDSVKYGPADAHTVPKKRGVYAFVVSQCSKVLPRHAYVMYVGLGGKKSSRTLRDRYGDYLNTKKILKRDRITRMIGTWSDLLYFAYAPVPDTVSQKDLMNLELEINSALLPPFSRGDIKATIKKMQRMFDE